MGATNGTQIKGTYNFDYAAPEILEEAQAFPQSDVWSLGVLLYVLMSSQLPFKGETPEESKDNILRVQFKFEWLYKECTMEGTRLLMWIFKRKPHARPSLEEVGAHRWTNPADYMLKKRERARFPTNRIQKFSKDYHKSRPWTWTASPSWPGFFSKDRTFRGRLRKMDRQKTMRTTQENLQKKLQSVEFEIPHGW